MFLKLLKLNLYPVFLQTVKYNLLLVFGLIGLGYFEFYELEKIGLREFLFGISFFCFTYFYHQKEIVRSYRENQSWLFFLPIKEEVLFLSMLTASLFLAMLHFLFFLVFGVLVIVLLNFEQVINLFHSQELNVWMEVEKLFIPKKEGSIFFDNHFLNWDLVDLFCLSFLFIIFSFIFLLLGFADHKKIFIKIKETGWDKKKITFLFCLLGFSLMYFDIFLDSMIFLYSFGYLLLCIFLVHFSHFTFFNSTRNFDMHLFVGMGMGVFFGGLIYSLSIYQVKFSGPEIAVNAFDNLGSLAPKTETLDSHPYKTFFDYVSFVNEQKPISLKTRLDLLKFAEKIPLKGSLYTFYNLNFLQLNKMKQKNTEVENAIESLDLKKISRLNEFFIKSYFPILDLKNKNEDLILLVLNEIKFNQQESENLLTYFLGLNVDKISKEFISNLFFGANSFLDAKLINNRNLASSNEFSANNWELRYLLGLYLARYKDPLMFGPMVKNHRQHFLTYASKLERGESKKINRIIYEIDLNLKMAELQRKFGSQIPIDMNDTNQLQSSRTICEEKPRDFIKGTISDEDLINWCYRKFFFDASGVEKHELEKLGWINLASFKENFSKLRNPIINHFFKNN